ncbi:hypothetical protein C8Q76DRAFT_792180 [Earliella scabrosa]|nr:hypothetical protein C8Q76DRAFT_792180 [Earliella scabrosa]
MSRLPQLRPEERQWLQAQLSSQDVRNALTSRGSIRRGIAAVLWPQYIELFSNPFPAEELSVYFMRLEQAPPRRRRFINRYLEETQADAQDRLARRPQDLVHAIRNWLRR